MNYVLKCTNNYSILSLNYRLLFRYKALIPFDARPEKIFPKALSNL